MYTDILPSVSHYMTATAVVMVLLTEAEQKSLDHTVLSHCIISELVSQSEGTFLGVSICHMSRPMK